MLFIRSTLFNIAFYINTIGRLIAMGPTMMFGTTAQTLALAKKWASTSVWLHAKLAGTHIEIEGLENIPEGGFIFAAQHQSSWDTFVFMPLLRSPVFIYKKELNSVPLFGHCLRKTEMIAVDRKARGKAMAGVLKGAKHEVSENGRQLFIFPEGTRRPAGADFEYKFGVGRIYKEIDVPIVPVALVSGVFWPRNSYLRQPGRFKARILSPIETGLSIEDVMAKLIHVTEEASDDLLMQAVKDNPHLKLSDQVIARIALIKAKAV
jgi:1-acyl-sn-glycerol-3-phosphate acyltransferase